MRILILKLIYALKVFFLVLEGSRNVVVYGDTPLDMYRILSQYNFTYKDALDKMNMYIHVLKKHNHVTVRGSVVNLRDHFKGMYHDQFAIYLDLNGLNRDGMLLLLVDCLYKEMNEIISEMRGEH